MSELDALLEWARDNYPHPIIAAFREYDVLRARVASLEQALRKHGEHAYTCPARKITTPDESCNCGIEAAINPKP